MIWTEEFDASLKIALNEGCSFSQAASILNSKFGTRFTRNAAIGRAMRLCLTQPMKVLSSARPVTERFARIKKPIERRIGKPVKRERRSNLTGMVWHDPEKADLERASEPLRIADVVPLYLNLLDLAPGQCRYPFGDGPFTFCGCQQFGGSSYCEPHLSLTTGFTREWTDERRHRQAGVARRSNNRKAA